jgi:hypothetical protein
MSSKPKKLIGGRAGVMVKLEKPAAVQRLDEIIELADGLMVARGDRSKTCRSCRSRSSTPAV